MPDQLTGVFVAEKKNHTIYYRASMTCNQKHISLGSFDSSDKAHKAYLEGCLLFHSPNVLIADYTNSDVLPFDKWVSICNFRDNRIYICNPIYIRPKFFYYYLAKNHALIFDIDDLFYYSSHKIMQRKGHLFVADYGMQVNILNRYGIKNYGVCPRDFRFVNGDSNDFRYENIEIINRYNGVQKITEFGHTYYLTKIHLHGDYIIGRYHTEDQAAIAYNKAIDILKGNGCRKNFVSNYLEGLSPSVYADIYHGVTISDKIVHFNS